MSQDHIFEILCFDVAEIRKIYAGHFGSRFSMNAPIPSQASASSMFSVITWLAKA